MLVLASKKPTAFRNRSKKLATDKAAKSLRFFGKIYGLNKDYYIVEADVEGGDEAEPESTEG